MQMISSGEFFKDVLCPFLCAFKKILAACLGSLAFRAGVVWIPERLIPLSLCYDPFKLP